MSGAVVLLLSPLHAFMAWTEVKVYVTRLYFLNHALLDGPEIEFRWGRDILHTSGPGAQTASYAMGTGSLCRR